MEKNILEQLISEGKSQRQIAIELECSQSNIRHWLSVHNLSTSRQPYNRNFSETTNESTKTCGLCGVEKDLVDYRKRKNGKPSSYCKECQSSYTSQRRRDIKLRAIDYKGGECQVCGYDKYPGALQFHHLDPNEKDFNIAYRGHSRSWKSVKEELDKCIMVCANCHAEIHGEFIQPNK
jgi:predicted transcriptional regulator